MSHRNILFVALTSALLFKASAVLSQALPQLSSAPTNKPALKASLQGGETVGDHQVQRAFLNAGTNSIAFIVPQGFRMDASDSSKIVLSENSSTFFITVRITDAVPGDSESQESSFKKQALARFPGAVLSNQFAAYAASHSGQGFDLEWTGTAGVQQSSRIVFVSSPAGTLEFSIMTRTTNFGEARRCLTALLSSVVDNANGKLVIKPLPSFS